MTSADYHLLPEHAAELAGAATLPREFRVMAARKLLNLKADPAEIIADLIGIANSVIENSHELLKIEAVSRGLAWPEDVEKINFPTMNGALMGVSLASGIDASRVCAGCAFRLGSIANQCAPTQYDAREAVAGEYAFMCHEDIDASGKPLHGCRGYALARTRA